MLREEGVDVAEQAIAPRGASDEPAPSFAQERPWFIEHLPARPAYHIPATLLLRGPLDPGLLAPAIAQVVARHEALRSAFPTVAGRPALRVAPPAALDLP